MGKRGIPLSKFDSYKKKFKAEEATYLKKEENKNIDFSFVFFISAVVILASSLIIKSFIVMEPCAVNFYEKESFCIDCISPLGAFCNKCNEFNVCAECKKGYYIGNITIADIK